MATLHSSLRLSRWLAFARRGAFVWAVAVIAVAVAALGLRQHRQFDKVIH